jgi:hypothetical protein
MRPGVVPNAQTLVAADDNVTMLLRPGYLDCGMPIVANRTDVGAGEGKKGRESGRGGEREGGGRERGREERGREERERGREEKRGERLGLKIASSRQKNNLISKENISHRKKKHKTFSNFSPQSSASPASSTTTLSPSAPRATTRASRRTQRACRSRRR